MTLRLAVAVLLGAVAVAGFRPPVAEAQMSLTVAACGKIEPASEAFFFDLRYSRCGTRFTSKDPYIGLVVHLRNVEEHTRVTVEVLDPAQIGVWKRDQTIAPPGGSYYPNVWVWVVLPVAANVEALAAENVRLTEHVIRLTQKSAAARLGEWTLRAQVEGPGVRTLKFTVQAEP